MKILSTSVSLLLAWLGRALGSLQALARPAPVLTPIPIRVERGRYEPVARRRHPGA